MESHPILLRVCAGSMPADLTGEDMQCKKRPCDGSICGVDHHASTRAGRRGAPQWVSDSQVREFHIALGEKIREVRLEHGIGFKDLCAVVKMSQSTLARIESGARSVRMDLLYRIARGIGVSVYEIIPFN